MGGGGGGPNINKIELERAKDAELRRQSMIERAKRGRRAAMLAPADDDLQPPLLVGSTPGGGLLGL